jgi:hypothetical protein
LNPIRTEPDARNTEQRCLAADLFTVNSLMSVTSLILINFLYFLRLIETFTQKVWLHIELHLYVTMAVLHLIGGFALFVHGIRFWALAMLALGVSGQFGLLAGIRIMMIKLKVPAQHSVHDPDGNSARARDPNAKFVHRGRLITMWTS